MRAVAVQCAPGACKADNIAMAAHAFAACDQAELICLSEMWTCLGGSRADKLAQSEALPPDGEPGPAYRFLQQSAIDRGVIVHGGSIGERVGDRLFNTSLVFGPDGRELARYRKIHLFDATTPSGQGYRESSLFDAGTDIVTCRAGGLTLGLTICYDLRFAELFLALRRAGADVILVPSAFTVETGRDHWNVLLRARAIETQCWIVAPATTGTHQDAAGRPRATYGHSLICDPWGQIRAQAGEAAGLVSASIDPAETLRVRTAMDVMRHRDARPPIAV